MTSLLVTVASAVCLLAGEVLATLDEHCTDLSYFSALKYTTTTRQCCDTVLKQVCTNKSHIVCNEVPDIQCEVTAWVDCKSTTTSNRGNKCSVSYKDYELKGCKEVKTSTLHTKQVPECKKVTRDNCVTDWEVDAKGNKIWAGTETCTPVVWEECDIVEKKVEFPGLKTECGVEAAIKWVDFVHTTRDIVGVETKCEVKKSVSCENVPVNKCASVDWRECKMEQREECSPVQVHTPSQDKVHRKKCLTSGQPQPEEDHLSLTLSTPKEAGGIGPAGLQWVSDKDWEKMEGGKKENPEIIVSSDARNTRWNKFCRTYQDGCWQTGWLHNPTSECYVAGDGWWKKSRSFQRLVNPANSVELEWRGWALGKKNLPSNAVYGSRECKWLAVRYTDSGVLGPEHPQAFGAQASSEEGWAYYAGFNSWQYDRNEYEILLEVTATKIELLSIEYDHTREDLSRKKGTEFLFNKYVENKDPKLASTETVKVVAKRTNTATWEHGITWSVGFEATATVGFDFLEKAELSLAWSAELSQNNNWGGSYEKEITFEGSDTIQIPPKHKRLVTVEVTLEEKDVPYKARVRITYKNGSKKEVTDVGRVKAKLYGRSFTTINEAIPL